MQGFVAITNVKELLNATILNNVFVELLVLEDAIQQEMHVVLPPLANLDVILLINAFPVVRHFALEVAILTELHVV